MISVKQDIMWGHKGYIEIKQPGKLRGRTLGRAWKRKWLIIHRHMNDIPCKKPVAIVEIFNTAEDEPNPKYDKTVLYLENVSIIRKTKSRTRPYAFEVCDAVGCLLYFAGQSEKESQTWIFKLRQIFWPSKPLSTLRLGTDLCFPVALIDNAHSERLGFNGNFILGIFPTSLKLFKPDDGSLIFQLQIGAIRRFMIEEECLPIDRMSILKIQEGQDEKCEYRFYSTEAPTILKTIYDNIHRYVEISKIPSSQQNNSNVEKAPLASVPVIKPDENGQHEAAQTITFNVASSEVENSNVKQETMSSERCESGLSNASSASCNSRRSSISSSSSRSSMLSKSRSLENTVHNKTISLDESRQSSELNLNRNSKSLPRQLPQVPLDGPLEYNQLTFGSLKHSFRKKRGMSDVSQMDYGHVKSRQQSKFRNSNSDINLKAMDQQICLAEVTALPSPVQKSPLFFGKDRGFSISSGTSQVSQASTCSSGHDSGFITSPDVKWSNLCDDSFTGFGDTVDHQFHSLDGNTREVETIQPIDSDEELYEELDNYNTETNRRHNTKTVVQPIPHNTANTVVRRRRASSCEDLGYQKDEIYEDLDGFRKDISKLLGVASLKLGGSSDERSISKCDVDKQLKGHYEEVTMRHHRKDVTKLLGMSELTVAPKPPALPRRPNSLNVPKTSGGLRVLFGGNTSPRIKEKPQSTCTTPKSAPVIQKLNTWPINGQNSELSETENIINEAHDNNKLVPNNDTKVSFVDNALYDRRRSSSLSPSFSPLSVKIKDLNVGINLEDTKKDTDVIIPGESVNLMTLDDNDDVKPSILIHNVDPVPTREIVDLLTGDTTPPMSDTLVPLLPTKTVDPFFVQDTIMTPNESNKNSIDVTEVAMASSNKQHGIGKESDLDKVLNHMSVPQSPSKETIFRDNSINNEPLPPLPKRPIHQAIDIKQGKMDTTENNDEISLHGHCVSCSGEAKNNIMEVSQETPCVVSSPGVHLGEPNTNGNMYLDHVHKDVDLQSGEKNQSFSFTQVLNSIQNQRDKLFSHNVVSASPLTSVPSWSPSSKTISTRKTQDLSSNKWVTFETNSDTGFKSEWIHFNKNTSKTLLDINTHHETSSSAQLSVIEWPISEIKPMPTSNVFDQSAHLTGFSNDCPTYENVEEAESNYMSMDGNTSVDLDQPDYESMDNVLKV